MLKRGKQKNQSEKQHVFLHPYNVIKGIMPFAFSARLKLFGLF